MVSSMHIRFYYGIYSDIFYTSYSGYYNQNFSEPELSKSNLRSVFSQFFVLLSHFDDRTLVLQRASYSNKVSEAWSLEEELVEGTGCGGW